MDSAVELHLRQLIFERLADIVMSNDCSPGLPTDTRWTVKCKVI
jgi:hypothetical protein